MHNAGYKSALARRVCRYSDARPPRKTDGVLLESESPPHMRGKGVLDDFDGVAVRITPAYAGKRADSPPEFWTSWDHPRVCGEKLMNISTPTALQGSPPRMRGKGVGAAHFAGDHGITPAYARKSETAAGHSTAGSGSPPHMQGKEMPKGLVHRAAGITPAYAGKSLRRCRSAASCRDHPRICGEKRCSCVTSPHTNGSPPHMRGKALLELPLIVL